MFSVCVGTRGIPIFGMPLSYMHLRKNDILASDLLLTALAISVGETAYFLMQAAIHRGYLPTGSLWKSWVLCLLETLAQVIFFRAVRRGEWWSKVVVLLASLFYAYMGTQLNYGYVAGVAFYHLDSWALLKLLKDILVLAALVLIFIKPRAAAPSGT
jgi:hypothetical protein